MEIINEWKNVTLDSLSGMGKEMALAFPKILGPTKLNMVPPMAKIITNTTALLYLPM